MSIVKTKLLESAIHTIKNNETKTLDTFNELKAQIDELKAQIDELKSKEIIGNSTIKEVVGKEGPKGPQGPKGPPGPPGIPGIPVIMDISKMEDGMGLIWSSTSKSFITQKIFEE
jgi:hypothetical protein